MTVILTQQVGNDGKLRVCNATCHNARKPKCDCICGGTYHGQARGGVVPTREQVRDEQSLLDALAMRPTTKETGHGSDYEIWALVGRKVRSLKDFSGVPTGTEGIVESGYGDKRHAGVMVKWTNNPSGNPLSDGFGRDAKFDETSWLEVITGETSRTLMAKAYGYTEETEE